MSKGNDRNKKDHPKMAFSAGSVDTLSERRLAATIKQLVRKQVHLLLQPS
jgi:hypothetical protein